MNKIDNISGRDLFGRIPGILKALEAQAGEFSIPPIIYFSFTFSELREILTFNEGHRFNQYSILDGKFGMAVNSSEESAMGGKGMFLNMRLYRLSRMKKVPMQVAEVSYIVSEKCGTFRSITLGEDEKEQTFASLPDFEEAVSGAATFVSAIVHTIG